MTTPNSRFEAWWKEFATPGRAIPVRDVKEFSKGLAEHVWLASEKAMTDRIHQLEAERDKWKRVVKDDCEIEDDAKKIVEPILGEHAPHGDSYGVPTIADLAELLVKRITALEEGLRKYGRHKDGCEACYSTCDGPEPHEKCTCGLTDLLEGK